ncbi:MAG: CoA transferase, partial [Chloroflexi bacterium]|nr:CoA transferase [Chloroflexota bacterium]
RGLTLNLETRDGRAIFRQLAAGADFVLESGRPGEMARLGLGYDDLAALNPRLVMTSITPFGQTGPHAQYAADDLTVWAMGGEMYVTGDPSRAPVAIGWPQAFFHGGAEGAAASLIAHWEREASGQGQYVDVSIQQTVVWTLMDATAHWAVNRTERMREGSRNRSPNFTQRRLWPCKDGIVVFPLAGGNPTRAASWKLLAAWMEREGHGD